MNEFTEDYYLNGVEKGLSNYVDYRWLPHLTIPLAENLVKILGARPGNRILDYGCARGYLVRALRSLGYYAFGYDISKWAIDNCDPEARMYVSNEDIIGRYDYVISKDVLEHIPESKLEAVISEIMDRSVKSALFVVPLAMTDGGPYYRPEDEQDITHKIRWTFDGWLQFLQHTTQENVLGTTHIKGIKPASKEVPGSTGFYYIKK